MAYGDGSIKELFDKDGKSFKPKKWQVRVCFGVSDEGEYKYKSRTVRGTKKDANKKRDELKREAEMGISTDGAKMTFKELAGKWIDSRKGIIADSTMLENECTVNVLNGYIGSVKLERLTPAKLERLVPQIQKDRGISGTRAQKYFMTLRQIFGYALKLRYVSYNPCEHLDNPKREKPDRKDLTPDQFANLLVELDKAEKEQYADFEAKEQRRINRGADGESRSEIEGLSNLSNLMVIRFALLVGMRKGEILGLTWEHVDLKERRITISQSLSTVTYTVKDTKTEAGKRFYPIGAEFANRLKAWKSFQLDALSEFGITAKKQEKMPVCCSNVGGWLNNANLGRWWREWREKVGCSGFTIHELRHTNASQLVSSGFDPVTIIAMMGWSSIRMLDVYAHPQEKKIIEAGEHISELFSSAKLRVIEGGKAKKAV